MDPITCGIALVGAVGGALWHAVVDIGAHETFHKLRERFQRSTLQNHDVIRVLREAYQAALSMVEKELRARHWYALPRADQEQAAASLKTLRGKAEQIFPNDAPSSDETAPDFLEPGESADRISKAVLAEAGPMPGKLREIFESSFADLFVFCFKELGLKRDEKVRSVLYYELFQELRADLSRVIGAVQAQESQRRVEERFHAFAEEALGEIRGGVARIEEKVTRIEEMLRKPQGEVRGYAFVFAESGQELSRHPIASGALTIGRDAVNTIQLPDAAVSGRHAEIVAQGMFFVVRDLGSMNGTFVGKQQVKSKPVGFGDRIGIGPFVIELREPQGPGDLESPRTVPRPGRS